jgi:hypothetical protein
MGLIGRSLCRIGLHRWRSSPDPADAYLRCTRCEPPQKAEVESLRQQLEGAVEALEQIALLLEALPHGPLTANEQGCLERAQMIALPFTAGGQ